MQAPNPRFLSGQRLSGFPFALAAISISAGMICGLARAQDFHLSRIGEKIVVESAGASPVSEKIRAGSPGVLVAVFVKVGDTVKKGQVLGHTELAATKYQLDLARHAMENEAALRAMQGQAEAWAATREETQEAVRKRKVEESRLDWASGMERFHRNNYEAQLEQKKLQRIQYEYWQQQYESRFFKAPADGVVTEVLLDIGKPVNHATHVFTVGNKDSYVAPVTVPAEFAAAIANNALLPIRATNGRHVTNGLVDSISDDPKKPGFKIIRLLVNRSDFPAETGSNLSGTKFDVLLPQTPESSPQTHDNSPPTGDPVTVAPGDRS